MTYAYILVLIFVNDYGPARAGGLGMHEFANARSCRAALAQLTRADDRLSGYCVPMETE